MEQQFHRAQKMEALGTLAGGIAHDFNNLLMGIQGNVSLLLLDADQRDERTAHLKNIKKFIKRGGNLTRQLLGLARAGKYEIRTIDINALVSGCAAMFGQTRKEITIHCDLADDAGTTDADTGQIEQVLLNLFVNASQAMPDGGHLYLATACIFLDRVAASAHGCSPGDYVAITVRDTGPGIDRQIRERVFDPFFTTKEKERGTGLGLASAYGIIKNHNGFIEVQNGSGGGASFRICLPASHGTTEEEKKAPSSLARGDETILLVDDEEMIIDVGSQMLARLGYTVISAASGQIAIDRYERLQDRIHLVILDMIMPGLSAGSVFDRLKEINSGVRVLLSSGYSLNGQAADLLSRGCDAFIQKPFDLHDISHKIRKVLDRA